MKSRHLFLLLPRLWIVKTVSDWRSALWSWRRGAWRVRSNKTRTKQILITLNVSYIMFVTVLTRIYKVPTRSYTQKSDQYCVVEEIGLTHWTFQMTTKLLFYHFLTLNITLILASYKVQHCNQLLLHPHMCTNVLYLTSTIIWFCKISSVWHNPFFFSTNYCHEEVKENNNLHFYRKGFKGLSVVCPQDDVGRCVSSKETFMCFSCSSVQFICSGITFFIPLFSQGYSALLIELFFFFWCCQ